MKAIYAISILSLALISCKENVTEENSQILIPIDGFEKVSAASDYLAIESFAKSFDGNIKLMSISSQDVDSEGYSQKWDYTFISTGKMILYHFHRQTYTVAFDSVSALLTGVMAISTGWINSSAGLSSAENNGGREFREKYGGCKISASLGQALVPNSFPCWYITYSCQTNRLYIRINAVTGELVSN